MEAIKTQQLKLQVAAQAAAADLLAREQAAEQAADEEKKLSDLLAERKRGSGDQPDDYDMGEDFTWAPP